MDRRLWIMDRASGLAQLAQLAIYSSRPDNNIARYCTVCIVALTLKCTHVYYPTQSCILARAIRKKKKIIQNLIGI